MNQRTKERLDKVHPVLAARVRLLIAALATQGLVVEVVQGLRTYAEQDALYAQGRTKPGDIVTNARGGQSNHNFGLACDLCPFTNNQPDWKNTASFLKIGAEAAKVGLAWGGNWHKLIDKPHVELAGPPLDKCRVLFETGGLAKVWQSVVTS